MKAGNQSFSFQDTIKNIKCGCTLQQNNNFLNFPKSIKSYSLMKSNHTLQTLRYKLFTYIPETILILKLMSKNLIKNI
jgi:hypothetical protein